MDNERLVGQLESKYNDDDDPDPVQQPDDLFEFEVIRIGLFPGTIMFF